MYNTYVNACKYLGTVSGMGKHQPIGNNQFTDAFQIACELRMLFVFFLTFF